MVARREAPEWQHVLLKVSDLCWGLDNVGGYPQMVDGELVPGVLDPHASYLLGVIVGRVLQAGGVTSDEAGTILQAIDERGAEWVLEYLAEQERNRG